MRCQAVLFDMDGTVLDTLADLDGAVNRSLAEFGLPAVPLQQVRAALGNGAARLIHACVPQGTGPALEQAVLDFYRPWYAAHCRVETGPYPGIVPLMERLKEAGLALALISNKPDEAVQELAAFFFPGLLDAAVGERPGVPRKPDPASALDAARRLGVPPERCVYVGDSEVDVATALNAGMEGVAVAWGFRDEPELVKAGARRIVRTPEELEAVLRKL